MQTPSRPPLTLQQLVGAAERLSRKLPDYTRERWLAAIDEARDRLHAHPFVPLPLDAFTVEEYGKVRVVTTARPQDRLIEEALLPTLTKRLESLLKPCAHAYRPRRSTLTAALAASRALAAGLHSLAFLDIASFFPSIRRNLLAQQLRAWFDEPTVELIDALVSAPILYQGSLERPSCGIPLGRALSPVLSNAYLLPLDEAIDRSDCGFVRYADDLLVLASDVEGRTRAQGLIEQQLLALGLQLRAEKTRYECFEGSPLVYLGHTLDDKHIYERVAGNRLEKLTAVAVPNLPDAAPSPSADDARSSLRARTLYVTESGTYLRVEQGQVQVSRGREILSEVPLHRVDRVLILAGVNMTSGFLNACIMAGIPVVFFVARGRGYGTLVAEGMPNPLRLRAQYDLLAAAARRTDLARAVVRSKLWAMLKRLANVPKASQTRAQIREIVERLPNADNVETLRGHEGGATRAYYEGFALRLRKPGFEFCGRSKRPPRDPINSLLSFAYSLVFSDMQTALLAHGLDPYPGVLHDPARGHPALASDLSEPFRVLVADSFVLTLVNEGRVQPTGFETRSQGAVYMTPPTRRTVIEAYEAFVTRPFGGAKGHVTPRASIETGARAMLHVVLGEAQELLLPPDPRFIDNSIDEQPESPDREGVG